MTTTPNNATGRIPAPQISAEFRDANRKNHKSGKHVDECFICARGLTRSGVDNGWWIHMSTDGELIANDEHVDDMHGSQGCFPCGSECAKSIPFTHRRKMAATS